MNFVQRPVAQAINRRSYATWLATGALAAGIMFSAGTARAESNLSERRGYRNRPPQFLDRHSDVPVSAGRYRNAVRDQSCDRYHSIRHVVERFRHRYGRAQAGTGGDLPAGAVTARVLGNHFTAAVNLSATTTGAMSNGAGDTISWSEISVAAPAAIVVAPVAASVLAHPGTVAAPFADGAARLFR